MHGFNTKPNTLYSTLTWIIFRSKKIQSDQHIFVLKEELNYPRL